MSLSRILITTLTLLLSLPITSFAVNHSGTVVLDNGRRIEDAEYKIVSMYKIVEIVSVEGVKVKLKYSFSRISALIDIDGIDVTEKYLGRFAVRKSSPNPTGEVPKQIVNPDSTEQPAQASPPADSTQTSNAVTPEPAPASSTNETTGIVKTGIPESDQTNSVTPKKSVPGEAWVTNRERKRELRPSYEKLQNIGFRFGGNYSFPAGDFYDFTSSGAGFGADLIIPISINIALRGTVSRSGMKWDDDFILVPLDDNLVLLEQESSISATRVSAAAEYYFFDREGTFPPKLVGFIYSGLGAIVHNESHISSILNVSLNEVRTGTQDFSYTEFITTSGVGVEIMISPSIGIETSANLDVIVLGSDGSSRAQYAYVFDLRLGVVSFF